ncbi:MAG: NUDIX hydrolase YfcD [Deferrisomatales bacterium]
MTIVDLENRVAGSATRREMRARRLPHRATYVLVFNSRGELFVQRRTASKDVYPSHDDVAAGGVVLAGEEYDEGAAREVEEELGVRGVPLVPHLDFYHEDGGNRVWGRVYSCVTDAPLTLQEEEVESGRFLPLADVLAAAETSPFTPDGLEALRRYLEVRSEGAPPGAEPPGGGRPTPG